MRPESLLRRFLRVRTTSVAFALMAVFATVVSAQNRPFPQHTSYVSGTIKPNNVSQTAMDDAVRSRWNSWKAAYLKPAGTGRYYVRYNSAGETVSEAHGYGMLLAVIMAGYDSSAKTYFDGLYNYYKAHPSASSPYLMSWKQNSSFQNIEGNDSATDGDMDIAYALLLADKQWGSGGTINYLTAARNCINAIMAKEVNQTRWHLRLGDWATDATYGNGTRPSDFMFQHMKAYKAATGDTKWDSVINNTYSICGTLFANNSPNTGLIPDFVIYSSGYKPAPGGYLEDANDKDYDYNSCRFPWRAGTDYLITGDTRALNQLKKINSWIKSKTASTPGNVKNGYTLGGTAYGSYASGAFVYPFGVSAMVESANQSWLNSIWSRAASAGSEAYYEDSIRLLSMIVMSGNWWSPGAPAGGPNKFSIPGSSVTASASHSTSYLPANTVDGSLSTRWAASGDGQWIQYDLGASKTIAYVRIAFYSGTSRTYTFDIQTASSSAGPWTTVVANKTSSGTTTSLEKFDFTDRAGRYVRIVGHQSNYDSFNNYTEVEVWGF